MSEQETPAANDVTENKTVSKEKLEKLAAADTKAKPAEKKKIKLSRITPAEKLVILDMLSKGKTVYAVAKHTGRSQNAVAAVAEDLKKKSLLAFGDDISSVAENVSIEPTNYIETAVYARVVKKLVQAGIDEHIAKQRIAKICKKAEKAELETITEEDLFSAAISTINGSELFGQSTNASVATTASSERGDIITGKKSTLLTDHVDNQRIFKIQ